MRDQYALQVVNGGADDTLLHSMRRNRSGAES